VRLFLPAFLSAATLLLACGDDAATSGSTGSGGGASTTTSTSTGPASQGPVIVGGDRPAMVFVPSSYAPGKAMPLVVMLHGYAVSSAFQEAFFGLKPLAEELGFLYLAPDGLFDSEGKRFWNATDVCCDFDAAGVDDSAYVRGLVDDVRAQLDVDPKRVFFVGHSNGGFMSYRMACDHADTIAAVVSLAGATFSDPAACSPSEPVAALQIHGTADDTIYYDGETQEGVGSYPSAPVTAETWAAYGGCDLAPAAGPARDLEFFLSGDESSTLAWATGCAPGGGAELWTIPGGTHIPSPSPTFTRQLLAWLFAHPKP
jgi:polyhydroxybutyrate depolymerase